MAEVLGISQRVYSRYERGFRTIPVTHLLRLTVLRQFFCACRVQRIWISASFVSSSMPSVCTMNCSRR